MSVAVMPRLRAAFQFNADDIGQAHPRGAAEHHALGFEAADADRDHTERIDVRRMAVGADQRIRKRHAVLRMDHRRHPLQIDLMHDAVARRNHVDVLERLLRPVDEMKAVFVAPVFDRAVLGERVAVKAGKFHRERMVDDELRRHDRIDLGRIAALVGDRIAQGPPDRPARSARECRGRPRARGTTGNPDPGAARSAA